MWVLGQESYEGLPLFEVINELHENPKYLPGVLLPNCVTAGSDPIECCKNADVLIFAIPHQYLQPLLQQLKGHVKEKAYGVSLIKGLYVSERGPVLISDMITNTLGLENSKVAVLMGAN